MKRPFSAKFTLTATLLMILGLHGAADLALAGEAFHSGGFAMAPEGALDIAHAPAPLFRDPVTDGAADPSVVWNAQEKAWYIFYTQRRANQDVPRGESWYMGTKIAIAKSADQGRSWSYVGTAQGLSRGLKEETFWAPHVFEDNGTWHLFVTFIPKVVKSAKGQPEICHYTSRDLITWEFSDTADVKSDDIIDPGVVKLRDGRWLMVFRDCRQQNRTAKVISMDLKNWKRLDDLTGNCHHEAPVVLFWKNKFWMFIDEWKGIGVYESDDGIKYTQNNLILDKAGTRADDKYYGSHPGVALAGDRAFIFYHCHAGKTIGIETSALDQKKLEFKRSTLQVAELEFKDGKIFCDRDKYAPRESNCAGTAVLRNAAAKVDFDLDRGVYSLAMPQSAMPVIRDAHASVEGWASTDAGNKRRVISKTADMMLIECVRDDTPAILLEFTLHPGFIEMRTGLKNTTTAPIRIKKFEPQSGGMVFPEGKWSNTRTLTANTAGNDPKVIRTVFAKSANNLLLTLKQDEVRRSLVIGALKTEDYTKWMHILPLGEKDGDKTVATLIEAIDPVGREVDPGETYMPDDSFYVDFCTPDPFVALEKYGMALREATQARPNLYDFPTVCAWYAGVWKTPGAQDHPEKSTYKINTSAGLVEEADKINDCGFLKYSRVAVRLVPDNYTEKNPQGWWDDEHWQLHGLYTKPFETTAKLGKGMHERGCLAFTYIQPTRIRRGKQVVCLDFRNNHVDWLIGKDVNNTLDYSLPAVQEYLRSRFARLTGNIDGFMVDYCDDLWDDVACLGRFSDRKMTATAFYRTFFKKLREGIGEEARIHERNVQSPDNELTVGLVDSQRTAWDTDKISPDIVSRSGLRWYKNRVIYSYDMDSKDLNSSWKVKGWTGSDQDGRRMMLTMAYLAASRLLTANSFRDLSKKTLYDLSRTFPYHTEPKSAPPTGAFVHEGHPRVYDFAVTPDWHQVTLYNNTLPTREETLAVPLAGDTADGTLGLDPAAEYYVYDFWNDAFAGTVKGSGTLTQTLRPGEARMLSIRKVQKHPQVLSTNRHIMQGYEELAEVKWESNSLGGKAKVVGAEAMKIVIALNGHTPVAMSNLTVSVDGKLAVLALDCQKNETAEWCVNFK